MDENIEYARKIYRWNDERTHLLRNLDDMIVAEVMKTKDVWVANNTSQPTKKKIGAFENIEFARRAVEQAFGLRAFEES
jgi:hypothetical protein